jgi:hypothetical protein
MIERELDGRLRRRGKEVIRDLEDGASAGEDIRRMRDDLAELRSLAGTLRERIEKLETGTGAAASGTASSATATSGKAKPGKAAKAAKPPKSKKKKR